MSRAADDRTFVLAAARKSLIALYLQRLTPQAGTARLNARPITVPTGGSLQFAGLALSPDGTQLAVGVNNFSMPARRSVELGMLRGGAFTPLRVQGTALTGAGAG